MLLSCVSSFCRSKESRRHQGNVFFSATGFGNCQTNFRLRFAKFMEQVHGRFRQDMVWFKQYPIPSMYGIFSYIWLIFTVNVGIYIYIPYMDGMGNGNNGVKTEK